MAENRKDFERALALNQQLLDVLEGRDDRDGERMPINNNIGWYLCRLGRCALARPYHERVLVEPSAAPLQRVHAQAGLGHVEFMAGNHKVARQLLEAALQAAKTVAVRGPKVVPEIEWLLARVLAKEDPERACALATGALAYYRSDNDDVVIASLESLLLGLPCRRRGD